MQMTENTTSRPRLSDNKSGGLRPRFSRGSALVERRLVRALPLRFVGRGFSRDNNSRRKAPYRCAALPAASTPAALSTRYDEEQLRETEDN